MYVVDRDPSALHHHGATTPSPESSIWSASANPNRKKHKSDYLIWQLTRLALFSPHFDRITKPLSEWVEPETRSLWQHRKHEKNRKKVIRLTHHTVRKMRIEFTLNLRWIATPLSCLTIELELHVTITKKPYYLKIHYHFVSCSLFSFHENESV